MTEPVPNGLAIACDLADAAADMVATRFRRENPTATDAEVADRVQQWWSDRPGAPDGDASGPDFRPRLLPNS